MPSQGPTQESNAESYLTAMANFDTAMAEAEKKIARICEENKAKGGGSSYNPPQESDDAFFMRWAQDSMQKKR